MHKLEIKITPVDNGFIYKTYELGGDQRIPIQTLVAKDLEDLFSSISELYNSQFLNEVLTKQK